MPEHRYERRRALAYPVTVEADGLPATPCRMMDVSQGGARLLVPENTDVPDKLRLILSRQGAYRECTVQWKRPGEIGVKFDRPRTASSREL